MAHFGHVLRSLIDRSHLQDLEFCEKADISADTLYRHLRSAKPPGTKRTYRAIAAALNLTPDQLDAYWKKPGEDFVPGNFTIPRISGVAAGSFREYTEDLMNREGVPGALYPYPMRDPMALRVSGSSMIAASGESIEDGDDVIFANAFEEEIPDGDIVVARRKSDDSVTVKRLRYVDKTYIDLVPSNPRYETIRVRRDEVILRRVKVIINYRYKRQSTP